MPLTKILTALHALCPTDVDARRGIVAQVAIRAFRLSRTGRQGGRTYFQRRVRRSWGHSQNGIRPPTSIVENSLPAMLSSPYESCQLRTPKNMCNTRRGDRKKSIDIGQKTIGLQTAQSSLYQPPTEEQNIVLATRTVHVSHQHGNKPPEW
eukprot:scaffold6276_cov138-Cylindrotheca_fusiformis.AAC.16